MIDAFRVLDSKGRCTTDRKVPDNKTKTDVNHGNGRNPDHSLKCQWCNCPVNAKMSRRVINFCAYKRFLIDFLLFGMPVFITSELYLMLKYGKLIVCSTPLVPFYFYHFNIEINFRSFCFFYLFFG